MTVRGTFAAALGIAIGLAVQPLASAQDSSQNGSANRMTSMAASDRHFAIDAAQGGMAEVELGNLAQQKASSDAVKQFGKRMVDDHSKANDELKQLASSKGITLPSNMGAKHQAMYDKLSKLSGEAFDRAYVNHMVADHRQDIAEFQKEANNGKDPEVKAWAAKTLPTLQEHLTQIESVQAGKSK